MSKQSSGHGQKESGSRSAADWFVAIDAGAADRETSDAFLAWLRSSPGNEADYEQCEALFALTGRLAQDEDFSLAVRARDEGASRSGALAAFRSALHWFARPGFRTGLAAAAIAGVVLGPIGFRSMSPRNAPTPATGQVGDMPTRATGQMGDTPAPKAGGLDPVVVELPDQEAAVERGDSASSRNQPTGVPVIPDSGADGSEAATACASNDASDTASFQDQRNGELAARILELQAELERLLRTYTSNHPDARKIERALETLEARRTPLRRDQAGQAIRVDEPVFCVGNVP